MRAIQLVASHQTLLEPDNCLKGLCEMNSSDQSRSSEHRNISKRTTNKCHPSRWPQSRGQEILGENLSSLYLVLPRQGARHTDEAVFMGKVCNAVAHIVPVQWIENFSLQCSQANLIYWFKSILVLRRPKLNSLLCHRSVGSWGGHLTSLPQIF